jgi:hypothetical protein
LLTALATAPLGILGSLLLAPFGGSLAAFGAALLLSARRSEEPVAIDTDELADSQVALLRGLRRACETGNARIDRAA